MPGTAEHRMVGYPVLNAELAKPTVCQIDLHLRAQPSLRADRKHVAHNVHPDHQHRIDRRATCMRVVGCKLLVHPIKIENAVDLPNQMIGRHRLVEIERVEELTLSALSPPHHRPLPANRSPDSRNHGSTAVSTRGLQHGVIPGSSQTKARESALQEWMRSASWDLTTMESDNGALCGAVRIVEADFDLCGERHGVSCARGRG